MRQNTIDFAAVATTVGAATLGVYEIFKPDYLKNSFSYPKFEIFT